MRKPLLRCLALPVAVGAVAVAWLLLRAPTPERSTIVRRGPEVPAASDGLAPRLEGVQPGGAPKRSPPQAAAPGVSPDADAAEAHSLRVRVVFKGAPHVGATVRIRTGSERRLAQARTTDKAGVAAFAALNREPITVEVLAEGFRMETLEGLPDGVMEVGSPGTELEFAL